MHVYSPPGGSDSEESAYNAGDLGSTPGLSRSPREGNGNPLQDSCLENPMDRGAWQAQCMGSQTVWHNWMTNTFTSRVYVCLEGTIHLLLIKMELSYALYSANCMPRHNIQLTLCLGLFYYLCHIVLYFWMYHNRFTHCGCLHFFFTIKSTLKILQTSETSE